MQLKIGLLNDSFPPTIDGVANTVLNYAKSITAHHGEALVVTPKYPHVTDDYPFPVYRYHSIPIVGPLGYRAGNPFSPLTISELHDQGLDLLHVHSPFASSVLAHQLIRPKKHRVPVVLTYHTKYEFDIQKFVKARHLQRIVKRFIRHNINLADEVWAVSQGAGESLRVMGYHGDFRVMPNGTDFARGKAPAAEVDELRRIYNITPDDLVFLSVGRMMWYKNIKITLDALDIIRQAGIPFRVIFVGEGADRPAIEQYARSLGLSDRAIFTGAIYDREKVRAYFSLANLFLFPSTYDTSGLVVKEAAACSCPSLLVAGSCAAEGVTDNDTGLLAEESAESCAQRILAALREPGTLTRIGRGAADRVYLSWDDAVAMAYKRYEEIIGNWPHPLPNLHKDW